MKLAPPNPFPYLPSPILCFVQRMTGRWWEVSSKNKFHQ